MKVKRTAALLALLSLLCLLGACTPSSDGLVVAFITDGSPPDEQGVNLVIWQTLESMVNGIELDVTYVQPASPEKDTLLSEIKKLNNKGVNLIFMHGTVFADVLQEAQILYPSCRFVALDFAPATTGDSVVNVTFAAHEAGFMAGFAAALRLEQGRFGAILGLENEACQQYSYGFQQGVLYANEHFETRVTMSASDFKYAGTLTSDSLVQQLAAQLYNSGVDCIFVAAGKAGDGAIIEARLRRANGEDIWAVGSEYTQYPLGVYDGNNSVIVTSAIKRWNNAIVDIVEMTMKDDFPGRQTLVYNAENGGVGIPTGEYNLTSAMRLTCNEVGELLRKGEVVVSDVWYDGLIR